METNDKKAIIIGIPLILIGLIILMKISSNTNKIDYENCINKGGKAVLQKNGYFERCIIGDDK